MSEEGGLIFPIVSPDALDQISEKLDPISNIFSDKKVQDYFKKGKAITAIENLEKTIKGDASFYKKFLLKTEKLAKAFKKDLIASIALTTNILHTLTTNVLKFLLGWTGLSEETISRISAIITSALAWNVTVPLGLLYASFKQFLNLYKFSYKFTFDLLKGAFLLAKKVFFKFFLFLKDSFKELYRKISDISMGFLKGVLGLILVFSLFGEGLIRSILDMAFTVAEIIMNLVIRAIPVITKALVKFALWIIKVIQVYVPKFIITVANSLLYFVQKGIPLIVKALREALPEVVKALVGILTVHLPILVKELAKGAVLVVNALLDAIKMLFTKENLQAILSAFISIFETLVQAADQIIKAIIDTISQILGDTSIINTLLNAFEKLFNTVAQVLPNIAIKIIDVLPDIFTKIINVLFNLADKILLILGGLFDKLLNFLQSEGFTKLINKVTEFLTRFFSETLPTLITRLANSFSLLISVVTTKVFPALLTGLTSAIESLLNAIANVLEDGRLITSIVDGFAKLLITAVGLLPPLLMRIIKALQVILPKILATLKKAIPKILEGIRRFFRTLVNFINANPGVLKQFVDVILEIFKTWKMVKSEINKLTSELLNDVVFSAIGGLFEFFVDSGKDAFMNLVDSVRDFQYKAASTFDILFLFLKKALYSFAVGTVFESYLIGNKKITDVFSKGELDILNLTANATFSQLKNAQIDFFKGINIFTREKFLEAYSALENTSIGQLLKDTTKNVDPKEVIQSLRKVVTDFNAFLKKGIEVSSTDLQKGVSNLSKQIVDEFLKTHALPKDYALEFRQFLRKQLEQTLSGAKALNKQNWQERSNGILKLQENLFSTSFEAMASKDKVIVELLEDIKNNTQQTADNTKQLVTEEQGAKYLSDILNDLSSEKAFTIYKQRVLLSNT